MNERKKRDEIVAEAELSEENQSCDCLIQDLDPFLPTSLLGGHPTEENF